MLPGRHRRRRTSRRPRSGAALSARSVPSVRFLRNGYFEPITATPVLVDDGRLGRHELAAAPAGLDLAHRLAVVRLAAEEQHRLVAVADGRGVERMQPDGLHPQREHRDDDLLDRAGGPRPAERHPAAVVRDGLRRRRGTRRCRARRGRPSARSARRPGGSSRKFMSSRTCSSGSPPWTSIRSRAGAGRHLLGQERQVGVVMRPFGRVRSASAAASAGQRRAMFARTSSKCRPRAATTAVGVRALAAPPGWARGARPTTPGRRPARPASGRSARTARATATTFSSSVRLSASSMIRPWKRASASATAATVVRAGGGLASPRQWPRKLGEVVVGQARHGQPRRRATRAPNGRRTPRGARAGVGPPDPRAAERRDLHDAEGLEAAQRLADRRLARAELAGDLVSTIRESGG